MKKLTIAALMTAFAVNANLEAKADVFTENAYFKNKAQVVADAKGDCADQVEMQIKVTPKSILKTKGEQAVRDHIQLTCAYSTGAAAGTELYKKSKDPTELNVKSVQDLELLDAVQIMRSAALRCGKNIESEWNKAGRPSVSQEESQDNLIYCMSIEGARDGWSFSAKTTKPGLSKMTEAQVSQYFADKCKRESNCYPQGTFGKSSEFACNKLITETETKWVKQAAPNAREITFKQKFGDVIMVNPKDEKFGKIITVIEDVTDVLIDKQVVLQLRHQCHINSELKILGVGRIQAKPTDTQLQLSYRKNGPDPIK